mgnify:CR=1 FL=1
MTTNSLLVELFVEELPPKALRKLGEAFAAQLFEQLQAQGLTAAESRVTPYATPRRLAVTIGEDAPARLDKALAAAVPEEAALSRSRLMRMIAEGASFVCNVEKTR